MESHLKDSEILSMAVQVGALTGKQLEDCIRERESQMTMPGAVVPKPIHTVAIEKGFLTEKRILEIAAEQKKNRGGSSVSIQITLTCLPCGKDATFTLPEALGRPRCVQCSAFLTVRPSAGNAVRTYAGPLPPEAVKALENPKNR
ncbi:MAG TPA: hypothetical protein VEN81_08510, partial [Planctomycetota bacterium]|nr:hypothetical protein [Planctomycetota bacterium]